MDSQIRKMTEADWPQVARIYGQGINTKMATFQNVIPSYEEWDQGHLAVGRLVAVSNEQISGWVALSATSAREVFSGVAEVSIYIDEGYRGQGIGKQLMEELFHISEEAGVWCIESRVFDDNIPSLKLHETCGFRTVGIREKIGYDQKINQWRSIVLLERRSQSVGLD